MSLGSTPPSSAFTTMEPLYGQKGEFCALSKSPALSSGGGSDRWMNATQDDNADDDASVCRCLSSIHSAINHFTMTDLAEFCEFVIANLFEVAPSSSHQQDGQRQGIDTPPYTPPPESETSTSTAAQRKEPPALVEFIVSRPSPCLPSLPRAMQRCAADPPTAARDHHASQHARDAQKHTALQHTAHTDTLPIPCRPTPSTERACPSPSSTSPSCCSPASSRDTLRRAAPRPHHTGSSSARSCSLQRSAWTTPTRTSPGPSSGAATSLSAR